MGKLYRNFNKTPNMKCQENLLVRGINGRMRSLCERASDIACRIVLLKCDGTRAETRFRLSPKRTSPFK